MPLPADVMSLATFKRREDAPEQLWKKNDRLAQKNGPNHAIYWAREVPNKDPLVRGKDRSSKPRHEVGNVYKGEWQNNQKHGECPLET